MGGCTPTVLSAEAMAHYLAMLGRHFELQRNRELTVETTPEAVLLPGGENLLSVLKDHGVNRINVGVQSFSDTVVRRNGRRQSAADIAACFNLLKKVGFGKLNLDLIYGLVGQTPEIWLQDLENAAALQPDSITTFSLRIRPPSRLHDMVTLGVVTPPPERDVLVMRMIAQKFLPGAGYSEDNADYFIKSPDKRYLYQPFQPHNADRNLIGLGPSAYSLAGDRQIFNVRGTEQYLEMISRGEDPIAFAIELTREEHMRKRLAEGLRTSFDDGVFSDAFGVSVHEVFGGTLYQLSDWGVVEGDAAALRLTAKGKVVHDCVAAYLKGCPLD
jgi:oxygen-independent coproporphyrinogen III oxidase